MNSQRDLRADLAAAERRVHEHPGYKEHVELEALRVSIIGVFLPNLQELVELLDRAAEDPVLAMELIQNVREPAVRERFQARATQRLHNYLASAQSLVDHVPRLMRSRQGRIVDEFGVRKAEVLANPEVPFMVNLRNYTLHRKLPFLGHRVSMTNVNTPEAKMESEVELGVADLLEWDGWPEPVRNYLEGHGKTVPLRPIVKKHGELLLEMNSWVHHELTRANDPALDEVDELIIQCNMVMTGGDRAMAERRARRDFS
jgi:hypothetical protein